MLDLEFVQASIDRWNGLNTEDANALVAELRAARDAVEALRRLPMPLEEESRRLDNRFLRLFDAWIGDLVMPALFNYDKATGESQ